MLNVELWQLAAGLIGLLAVAVYSAGVWQEYKVQQEIQLLYAEKDGFGKRRTIGEEDLAVLPRPVRQWLRYSGVVGKVPRRQYQLLQTGYFRRHQEEAWLPFTARQYFNLEVPGFLWYASMKIKPLLTIKVRDMLHCGRGYMQAKVLGCFTVVNEQGEAIDQGALSRFLAEMIWFPSAALSPFITWEETGPYEVRATLCHNGNEASGTFTFNSAGQVEHFCAWRYKYDEQTKTAELTPWEARMRDYREFGGILIPATAEVLWQEVHGEFVYCKMQVEQWQGR